MEVQKKRTLLPAKPTVVNVANTYRVLLCLLGGPSEERSHLTNQS